MPGPKRKAATPLSSPRTRRGAEEEETVTPRAGPPRIANGDESSDAPPSVAEFERAVQAFGLLPPAVRQQIFAVQGIGPSSAAHKYPDERIESFYENVIAPYIPLAARDALAAVEWDDVDIKDLFTKACRSLELRKPGDDAALKALLAGSWFESRLDTRSLPQPDSVQALLKNKPAEAAVDKALRDLQDGPVRDLLRVALHLGARATKPEPAPRDTLDTVKTELAKLKGQARITSSLSFSLLSEIHTLRRDLMWKVSGAKPSELRGNTLFEPSDRDLMSRIVEQREWEAKMLPKLAPPTGRGRTRGRAGRRGARARGGRRYGNDRSSGAGDSEGRQGSENRPPAADASSASAAPAAASAARSAKSPGGPKGKGRPAKR